ncbi:MULTISPECIES: EAL domain-containing protein [Arsenicicoccus]|uniref:EAL domain-containing protein n=1 Tax=Arsenicicoccus TaxID=267408 RepID=UPI00257C52F4|nr:MULTISPECIES: EAL domain-containing protein [Arsenicicoccus]
MYAAKQSNEAWRAYDPGMRAAAERRADADHEITRAWGAESVRLYLQPIVRTHDLAVHSVEALLRWVGADGRVVGPATVLDYATRTGHMTRLTEWVLSGTVTSLRRLGPGGIPVSVNLPTALLDVDDVAPRLEEMLRRGGLRPTDVHLELAEDAMVDRGPRSTQTVQGLRAPADAARLPSLRELASWGSFMGAGGVRHTTPSSFALGGAEC